MQLSLNLLILSIKRLNYSFKRLITLILSTETVKQAILAIIILL